MADTKISPPLPALTDLFIIHETSIQSLLSMNLYLCFKFMAVHIHKSSLFLSPYVKQSLNFLVQGNYMLQVVLNGIFNFSFQFQHCLPKISKSHKTDNIVSSSGH